MDCDCPLGTQNNVNAPTILCTCTNEKARIEKYGYAVLPVVGDCVGIVGLIVLNEVGLDKV